jgi:DNA-binding NarL/FixJ family response regulator
MDATPAIRLLLVSRHTLTRTALVRLIGDRSSIALVGEVGTRLEALSHAARETPDVILLEPRPGGDLWLDAIGPLAAAAGPQARVVLFTGLKDPALHGQALRHGARGVVDLDHPPENLYRAIERVHEGEIWMERRVVADLITSMAAGTGRERTRIDSLTPREHEVVQLVSQGLKNKQIADRLSIADVTVRHHLTSIFAKLEVSDRLGLVVFAFRHDLARPQRHTGTVVRGHF